MYGNVRGKGVMAQLIDIEKMNFDNQYPADGEFVIRLSQEENKPKLERELKKRLIIGNKGPALFISTAPQPKS